MSNGHRMVQLLDLNNFKGHIDGTLTRNEREVPRGEMCYFASPYDMPAYVRFWRRLRKKQEGKREVLHHEGVTMELDCFTFGVKVFVKHDMARVKGGTSKLTIFIEDGDGMGEVASYER